MYVYMRIKLYIPVHLTKHSTYTSLLHHKFVHDMTLSVWHALIDPFFYLFTEFPDVFVVYCFVFVSLSSNWSLGTNKQVPFFIDIQLIITDNR